MNKITFIYPYYDNPNMLERQVMAWDSYPSSVKDSVEIILVDDGSPDFPVKDVLADMSYDFNLRLFRVLEDIPWNQHGARNLGAKVANTDWLWMSDIDTIVRAQDAETLVKSQWDESCHYFVSRVRATHPNKPYKHHCNSFLVRKDHYWEIGGYDEDYSGSYGGDGPFLRALKSVSTSKMADNVTIVYYGRKEYPDVGSDRYSREGPMKQKYKRILKEKNKRGDTFPRKPIRFEWEEICLN